MSNHVKGVTIRLNAEKIADKKIIDYFEKNPLISKAGVFRAALVEKIDRESLNDSASAIGLQSSSVDTNLSKKKSQTLDPSDGFIGTRASLEDS